MVNGAIIQKRLAAYNRYCDKLFHVNPELKQWVENQRQAKLSDTLRQSATDETGHLNLVDLHIQRIAPIIRRAWDKDTLLSQIAQGDTLFNALVADRLINNSGQFGTEAFNPKQWSDLARQEATVALACRIASNQNQHYPLNQPFLKYLAADNWEYRSIETLEQMSRQLTPIMEAWHYQPTARYQEVMVAATKYREMPYLYDQERLAHFQLSELSNSRPQAWRQLRQLINEEHLDIRLAISDFMYSIQQPIAHNVIYSHLSGPQARMEGNQQFGWLLQKNTIDRSFKYRAGHSLLGPDLC